VIVFIVFSGRRAECPKPIIMKFHNFCQERKRTPRTSWYREAQVGAFGTLGDERVRWAQERWFSLGVGMSNALRQLIAGVN
jgi:hypothetical protein